jgi:hypothetical protein
MHGFCSRHDHPHTVRTIYISTPRGIKTTWPPAWGLYNARINGTSFCHAILRERTSFELNPRQRVDQRAIGPDQNPIRWCMFRWGEVRTPISVTLCTSCPQRFNLGDATLGYLGTMARWGVEWGWGGWHVVWGRHWAVYATRHGATCMSTWNPLPEQPDAPHGVQPPCACRSVPLGRPGCGIAVKKISVFPYSPPAKLKPAAATAPRAILDSPDRAESKLALGAVAGPGSGYEQAVTSCTLARARLPRGFRARGIFPKKSLS